MNCNKKNILIIFLSLLLYNCHDTDDIIEKRTVNIIVKYEDQTGLHTDYKSKIYIYYGIYSIDISSFTFSSDGTLGFKNQTIIPDIKASLNNQEEVSLILDSTKKITIVVQSNHFKGKVGIESYSMSKDFTKNTFIFKE